METNPSYVAEALPGKSDNLVDNVEKKCVQELEQMLLNGSVLKALKEPEIKGWRALFKNKETNKSALWFCKCFGFLSLIVFHVCVRLHVEG